MLKAPLFVFLMSTLYLPMSAQELKLDSQFNYFTQELGERSSKRQALVDALDLDVESVKSLDQDLRNPDNSIALMTSPHDGLSVYGLSHELKPYEVLATWASRFGWEQAKSVFENAFEGLHPIAAIDLTKVRVLKGKCHTLENGVFVGLLSSPSNAQSRPVELSAKVYDVGELIAEIEREPIQEPMPETEREAIQWYERHRSQFRGTGKSPAMDKALVEILYGGFWRQVAERGERREDYYAIVSGRLYLRKMKYFDDAGRWMVLQNSDGKFSVHHEVLGLSAPRSETPPTVD